MIWHKLLLLALFLVGFTNQTDQIVFKPIDDGIRAVVEKYLNRASHNDETDRTDSTYGGETPKERGEHDVLGYLGSLLRQYDDCTLSKGILVKRIERVKKSSGESGDGRHGSVIEDLVNYVDNHVIKVKLDDFMEDVTAKAKETTGLLQPTAKSFGLKNLMLPVMIGVQIVKSVLFAMFLPSLLGNLGRVVGEGVKYLSSQRYQSPTGLGTNMGQMEDFEFKDVNGYDNQQQYADAQADGSASLYSYTYPNAFDYGKVQQSAAGTYPEAQSSVATRFTSGMHKLNYVPNNNHHGSFYTKHGDKHGNRQDYKVFHNIPSSSLLLTNYDPFYSPLLSRMDSVFKQLGYETESCRERLICLMYKNPAKFAPYSNLISAQLSRELNELRKPSTDNPDILRFFKYMKAAKDGQDGVECVKAYSGCLDNRESISSPMVKTFNEINKLVHARKFSR